MLDVKSFERNGKHSTVVSTYSYLGPVERADIELESINAKFSPHSVWALSVGRDEAVDRFSHRLNSTGAERLSFTPKWINTDVSAFGDESGNKIYFRQKEVVIGFRRRSAVDVATIVSNFGLRIKWFDRVGNYGLFKLRQGSVGELLNELVAAPEVQYSHPNVLDGTDDFAASDLESDGIDLPQTVLWNHEVLRRDSGWSPQDGSGVLVCVVDTAIFHDHPGFTSQMLDPGRRLYFGDSKPIPESHGTSVASIVTDTTLTRFGHSVGLAPAAMLLPVAIDTSAMSSYVERGRAINFLASIAKEGAYVRTDGSRVPTPRLIVNCSWKVEGTQDLTSVRQAFASLANAGALCVCSAGNASSEAAHYPSDYPGCISVAGLTRELVKTKRSNFGKSVAFAMPGGDGTPYDNADIFAAQGIDKYDYVSGTSFAAPPCNCSSGSALVTKSEIVFR